MTLNNGSSNLASVFRQSETGHRTVFCPEDHQLAAWYEHRLDASKAASLEQHLSACGYCRSSIGILGRLDRVDLESAVSEDLLARAKQLASEIPAGRKKIASTWAAAAVIVLSLGVILTSDFYRSPEVASQSEVRQVRSLQPTAVRPEILQPSSGDVVTSGGLKVHWTSVDSSMFYELQVMDAAGRLLLTQRLQETQWDASDKLRLEPAKNYYVRVTAYLADGSEEGSRHSKFSVAAPAQEPGGGTK